MGEVRNAITQAIADGRYLLLDGSNSPMTGDIDMGENDITNLDAIYGGTTVNSGLTIAANTQATTTYPIAGIITEGWIGLYPDIPNTAAFVSTDAISFYPSVAITAVSNISVIRESGAYSLGGVFSSFGIISANGTATASDASAGACYLFVSQMTSKSTTAAWPPATYRSFDHRGIIEADGAAVGTTDANVALMDLGVVRAINNGVITVTDWITVGNASLPGLGVVSATAGSSATVTNRYGFRYINTLLNGDGGTEAIVNQYGAYVGALTSATTINCGIWLAGASGATANYGLVLASSNLFGGAAWFGATQQSKIGYDGTNFVIDPDVTGSGILLIGVTGDNDMRLTNVEIDGALNHDGSTAGFYATVPVIQQTSPAATTPSDLQAGDYGEIYAVENANATTISVQNTWYQFTEFSNVGQERGSTGSTSTDDITVGTTGIYMVMMSASFSGGAGKTYEIEVQKNNGGTLLTNLHTDRKLGSGGDIGSISISGLASLTATDTIELWIRCTDVTTANATLENVNLSLVEIGIFAGESATETDISALATETNALRTNLNNLGLQA